MDYQELIRLWEKEYGKLDEDQYHFMSHQPYTNDNLFNDKYLSIIYLNNDKPSREEILEQLWRLWRNMDIDLWLAMDDELSFLNHFLRKYMR